MKLWKDLFRTHILERGLNYYEEGYVTSLEQTLTGYTAVVEGTDDYDVEIEIRDDQVYDMTCTCPYAADGNYCKHMAAVLYEIEEGELDTKMPANYFEKMQSQKRELQEIIAGIPIKELPEIVFLQATSDDFLYNRIMTKYAPITPRYMIRLKQRVNDIGYHYSDRGGFVDYYHATDYTDALNTLLDENVPLLLEKNYRMEAFELVNCVFYEIGNRDMDDSDGGTSFVADKCYEYWQTMLQECNDKEKENMFQWFQDHQENYVIDYLEDYISDFLLNEFHDEKMLRKKLHMLDEKITKFQKENYSGDSYSAHYGMVNNITARIRLMEELFEELLREIQKNQSVYALDQYEKVLKKHLPNEVRDMYVQYVKKESTRTSDRKAYKYLMSYLKKITKYPNGKKIAQGIAENWRQDYKRRSAMMDELRKAGF